MNFRIAATELAKLADLTSDEEMNTGWENDRKTVAPLDVLTDGKDPATPGGASDLNGVMPLSTPVASDPLVPVPIRDPGGAIPHTPSIDVDQTTLKNWRSFGRLGQQ